MVQGFGPTIKRRRRNFEPVTFESRATGFSPWIKSSFSGSVDEEIVSQCHTGLWPPPLRSSVDVGGPMQLHRTWNEHTGVRVVNWGLTRGPIGIASTPGFVLGQSPAVAGSGSVIDAFGTSAIAAVIPTNPNASLAEAIGELKRDGLPRLPGSSVKDQVSAAKRAGDEYLNVEFGWLPLVNDLREFAQSVRNARALIDQYTRASDKKIRRRFVAPPILDSSIATNTALCYGQNNLAANAKITRSERTQLWFSGAFRYHVPIDDGFYGRLLRYEALSNYLFGTRITPDLIWNLAPWSWAIDWFTNVGDVIHNITQLGSDGLVMQYGYAMREMRVEEVIRATCLRTGTGSPASVDLERKIGSQWKQRVRANPYGFGIDDVDLSARQLAILAALGLTKSDRLQ